MFSLKLISTSRQILRGKPVFLEQKAWLNKRRKALVTRFCLEPGRRISAYFKNPNSHPGLLNGPDYSYLDHRPTPYGVNQYKRICQNMAHTEAIIQCNKEIDLALQMEKMDEEKRKAEIEAVLSKKLKPKGGTIDATSKKR